MGLVYWKRMESMDMQRLRARYGGRYVALFKGRVVTSARSHVMFMKKVFPLIRTKRLLLLFVPPKGVMCVYPVQT